MATLIDENADLELQEDEQLDTFEEAEAEEPTSEEQEAYEEEAEDDLPEKYKNKDLKEIVRMHQEAEKLLGRQSSEVGELRKVVDNFIMQQSQSQSNAPKQVEEDVDIFTDPDAYTKRAIESHPKVKEFERMTAQMKREAALGRLNNSHPDWQQVLSSESFGEWIKNSKVRQELFARADRNYDFDAANELLSTWKERQSAVATTKKVEEKEIKRQRKAAATGSGKGGGEGTSRKVYRRSDIINLMQTNPDRYAELADEIATAYAEGRVR